MQFGLTLVHFCQQIDFPIYCLLCDTQYKGRPPSPLDKSISWEGLVITTMYLPCFHSFASYPFEPRILKGKCIGGIFEGVRSSGYILHMGAHAYNRFHTCVGCMDYTYLACQAHAPLTMHRPCHVSMV